MKIILLTSTHNSAKHLPSWMQRVEKLTPRPQKIVFCENDSTDATCEIINAWNFPHELLRFTSKPNDIKNDVYAVIAKNRQMLLERARKLNPDYAIFLDDDVFATNDNLIDRLTSLKLDIVGGTYLRYFNNQETYIASQWSTDSPIEDMPQSPNLTKAVQSAKARGVPFLTFANCDTKLYKVTVTSAGCLCLSSKIVKDTRLNFFPKGLVNGYKETLSEDFEFCLLARALGYEIYLDGATRLDHLKPWVGKKRPWIKITYKYR